MPPAVPIVPLRAAELFFVIVGRSLMAGVTGVVPSAAPSGGELHLFEHCEYAQAATELVGVEHSVDARDRVLPEVEETRRHQPLSRPNGNGHISTRDGIGLQAQEALEAR